MEEDCDVKPCDIKLESEYTLDDDYNEDNYSDACQEANPQVANTVLLKSDPVGTLNRLDLSLLNGTLSKTNPSSINDGVAELKVEIKEEITEDEDPLAGAVPSDEWPVPCETASTSFYEGESTVFPKDFQIKSENDLPEGSYHRKEMPIYVPLKSGAKKGTQGKLSQNCDKRNTCSAIRIKTRKIKDTTSDISQDSRNQTLPNASDISFHPDKQPSADSGKRPFKAKHCPAGFTDKDKSNAEESASEEYFCCKYCSAQFDEINNFLAHVRTHYMGKSFSCKKCSAQYALKRDLVAHMRTHSNRRPFCCGFCPLRFTRHKSLQVHLRIHSSEKLSCKYCPAQFNDQSSLTAHLHIHSGEKPFSCEHCQAQFKYKSYLTAHLRIHSGEKPFSCELCSARFSQKGSLSTHLRSHSGEKPFTCKQCPARYAHKNSLLAHLSTHSGEKPFSCKHCQAQFRYKSYLAIHLRIHSGQKSFFCKHCAAGFTNKSNLNTHLRAHSSDKPLSCPHCPAQFKWNSSFNYHLRSHSGNKPSSC